MLDGNNGWYLVRTKPLSEYVAARALQRTGYDYYFPRVLTPQPRSGYSDSPLFPGYLFIRWDQDAARLPAITNIAGLMGWVRFDGVVPRVPDDVITELDQRLEKINRVGGHWKSFRAGEHVLVTSGSLEDLVGVVAGPESPQSRVRVLLEFMGQLVPTLVPREDLQPVQDDFFSRRRPRRTRGGKRWIRGFGPGAAIGAPPTSLQP